MATPLPTTATLTTPPSSHAAMRENFANLRAFLAGLLGADGLTSTALATLGALMAAHVACAAATTVAVDDRGKLIACSGTWALTLPSAVSAAAGWCIVVRNSGTGAITVTPVAPTLIDGAATLQIAAGRTVIVVCTGTDFFSLPFFPRTIAAKRILGNSTAAAGAPQELTATQLTAMLGAFSDTAAGVVPATGGAAAAFLRGDGTWTTENLMLLDATQTVAGIKRFSGSGAFVLSGRAADPTTPEAGQIWHDAATGHIKAFVGNESRVLDGQSAIPMLVPVSGEYAMTTVGCGGGALGAAAGYANRMDLFPYVPRADMAVAALAVNCTAAMGGALGKFVIYASDAAGRPAALLIETATVDLSATGVKEAAHGGMSCEQDAPTGSVSATPAQRRFRRGQSRRHPTSTAVLLRPARGRHCSASAPSPLPQQPTGGGARPRSPPRRRPQSGSSFEQGDAAMATELDFDTVDLNSPALSAFSVTPSDTVDLAAPVRAVTIGTAAGVVKYTHARTGAVCTTGPLPVGTHSIWARRIWATGTTATGLTGWE
ncbi:hypothetical protein C8J30_108143 [Rhodobacter viridis]|uniref:Uncharacterized protein n=1 Tax=Rhodobacter viridis TaxID=1054202 RepID=A0A318TXY6_9RHOB|nr:hypothetical protein [Rhodobacter viridis]PYF09565.1 hypothetical protein C8J30_108143 [Rhodobacter viridis]